VCVCLCVYSSLDLDAFSLAVFQDVDYTLIKDEYTQNYNHQQHGLNS